MKYLLPIILVFVLFFTSAAQVQNPEKLDERYITDTTIHSVDLSEFIALLPRDAFKVLNYPGFLNINDGLNTFFEHEPVLSVNINNRAKAYPLNILTYHEISNDTLSGKNLLVSFCPLCNSGIVFDRTLKVDGEEHTAIFGVSGMLRKSDMVMWDDITESWWQQLTGEAIVGKMTGTTLEFIPSQILSVKEFFDSYPDGLIMSKKTGFEKSEEWYGRNRYTGYDSLGAQPRSRFFQDEVDSRLPAMERIVEVSSRGYYKVYPYTAIQKAGVINDEVYSKKIVLFHQPGTVSILDKEDLKQSRDIGTVTVFSAVYDGRHLTFSRSDNGFVDDQTGSSWTISGKCIQGDLEGAQLRGEVYGNHFAFAWFAFHPESEIYNNEDK